MSPADPADLTAADPAADPAVPAPPAVGHALAGNALSVRAEAAIAAATGPCDYCERPIIWTITDTAGRMPVDAEGVAGGNLLVLADGPLLRVTVVARQRQRDVLVAQGYTLRTHHKLTCPFADEWSRPGGPKRGAQRRPQHGPAVPARRGAGQAARHPRGAR